MHKQRKQSTTTYPINFLLVSSADHITAVTGLGAAPVVTLSKNGAAFGAAIGAVSEIGSGWYSLAGNATDRNTLGELLMHATGAGADAWDGQYEIVPQDPFVGVLIAPIQDAITWAAQTITTAAGDALTISSTGANGDGVSITGNGTGAGLNINSGATGYGAFIGSTGNNGLQVEGGGAGATYGAEFTGSAVGINATGGTDYGIAATGAVAGSYNLGSGAGSYGQYNSGNAIGQRNTGAAAASYGQYNDGGGSGQGNVGTSDYGQSNVGGTTGLYANGTAEYGVQAIGGTADTDPDWTGSGAVAAALAAIDLDHLIQVTAGAEEPTDGSYLDQIMHKDGSQTFDATTDSLEAISDKLTSAQITVVSPVAGTMLTIVRGDTLTASFSGLGNIATRTKLWFTLKSQKTEADAAAAIQVLESNPAVPATDGLQRLNGAATTAGYGTLTVTDAAAGNVTLTLTPQATSVLRETARYYDIQVLKAGGAITTLTLGECDINLGVTAAIV